MEELQKWYDSIKEYPKLHYAEARELYIKYLEEPDIKKKKKIKEELINGTLYIVYSYISNYNLYLLKSNMYDIEDIISTSIEVWIELINKGKLLNSPFYSSIFQVNYFNKLTSRLGIDENTTYDLLQLNGEEFAELMSLFIKKSKNGKEISFNEFKALIDNNPMLSERINDIFSSKKLYTYSAYYAYLYKIVNSIYNLIAKDKEVNLSPTIILSLRHLLASAGLENMNGNVNNIVFNNLEDSIIKEINKNAFLESIYKTPKLSSEEKLVIYLFLKGYNSKDIAEKFGCSRQNIDQKLEKIPKRIVKRRIFKKNKGQF